MNFNLKCIDEHTLQTLTQTIPFPILIFNQNGPLFCDDKVKELLCNENYNISYEDIFQSFKDAVKPINKEIIILNPKLEKNLD